ncbi:MAG: hypothetical protein WC455_24100 [Dehalococcoidia bacterium]
MGCEGGVSAACIVISGQKLSTPQNMVGTGSACDPGDWMPRKAVCTGCGHTITLFRAGCGLVSCPRCSKRWARRAAERSAARVYGAFMARLSAHKPRHITFEVPWWTGAKGDWDKVKDYAENTIGCTGGILVVHPWRIKDDVQKQWESLRDQKKTDENRYDWTKRVYGMAGFEWAPHCHSIAYGKFAEVEKGSETFLYRNIRRVNTLHGLEGVITYLMTHTYAPRGKEMVYRYFGFCSPQKLKPIWTGEISEPMYCEHCGKMMVEEGTNELIMHRHYVSLGWHSVRKKPKGPAGGTCAGHAASA